MGDKTQCSNMSLWNVSFCIIIIQNLFTILVAHQTSLP